MKVYHKRVKVNHNLLTSKTMNCGNLNCLEFGTAMIDGRLTMPSDGKTYRLRDAINFSIEIGRPLSEEEMKTFEI